MVGSTFLVNTTNVDDQRNPTVEGLADGGFIVAWQSSNQDDDFGLDLRGVYGQRYDASGAQVAGEFRINTTRDPSQEDVRLTALDDGGFVAVWRSFVYPADGNGWEIFRQRFGPNGEFVGPEFQVNTISVDWQHYATVETLANGDFLVVWETDGAGGSATGSHIAGQRYNSTGQTIGGEFSLSMEFAGRPSFSPLANGGFVATWNNGNIAARIFDASGNPVAPEFQVNTSENEDISGGYIIDPVVEALVGGGFLVVRNAYGEGGLFGQQFDDAGNLVGSEFQFAQLGTGVSGEGLRASITALDDGSAIVTWWAFEYPGQDEFPPTEIYSQRFSPVTVPGAPVALLGSSGDNTINLGGGDEHFDGKAGDDTISGGGGDDTLLGGTGDDIAVYSGLTAEYTVTDNGDGTTTVADLVAGRARTDTVIGVETLSFSDSNLSIASQVGSLVSAMAPFDPPLAVEGDGDDENAQQDRR